MKKLMAVLLTVVLFALACTGCMEQGYSYGGATGSSTVTGATINVPGGAATVTDALLRARAGDVVQIAAGMYSEETGEKFPLYVPEGVTVRGDNRRTVIQMENYGRGGHIFAAENDSVTIEGVTLAAAYWYIAAIDAKHASDLSVLNCDIQTDIGIRCQGGSHISIRGNVIYKASEDDGWYGVELSGVSNVDLARNTIGRYYTDVRLTAVDDAYFHENIVYRGDFALQADGYSWVRSVFEFNDFSFLQYAAAYVYGRYISRIPGEGNIGEEPRFVSPRDRDFRLQPGSPCATAGPTGGPIGAMEVATPPPPK